MRRHDWRLGLAVLAGALLALPSLTGEGGEPEPTTGKPCVAEQLPEWAGATALEKRALLRRCRGPEPVARPASAPASVPVAAEPPLARLEARGRPTVVVRGPDGTEFKALVVSTAAEQLVVARLTDGEVVLVERRDVVGAQAPPPRPPPSVTAPLAEAGPDRPRHVALQLGLAPSLVVDAEFGRFYGFLGGSVLAPFFAQADLIPYAPPYVGSVSASSQIWAFGLGAGATVHAFSGSSCWALDAFALASLDNWHLASAQDGVNLALGVGLGFHCTTPGGLTLGFKLPIVGASLAFPVASARPSVVQFGHFYLAALVALPLMSVGYRF